MKHAASPLRAVASAIALAAAIASALPAWSATADDNFAGMIGQLALVPPGPHDSDMLTKATAAVGYIKKMDLPRAQLAINEALQLDARNSYLHFLNGFVYHLQAKQGDTQKGEIAIEGYQQALRIDPSNWIAREFLGLAYTDLKQFNHAKSQFSEVLLMTPDSAVSIHGLMVSSYLTGDAVTACAMADQFRKVNAQPAAEFLRSSISVYASCGDFDQADRMRASLAQLSGTPEAERADRRLAQWKSLYRQHGQGGLMVNAGLTAARPDVIAQAFNLPPQTTPSDASQSALPVSPPAPAPVEPPRASTKSGPRMVLIDVVLLSTQELVSTSKGVNLLNALTLQLGSSTGPAYSRVTNTTLGGAVDTVTTAITRALTIPALSYSLNIANANNSVNEVLARPTLAAIEGLPSEFFSGTNLSAGVVSTSTQGGTTVVPLDKRFGIKLAVTPVFLPQGQIQLKVDAQRTSLNAASDNPRVAYQIEIAEIVSNANVVMNIGDTLVLSGLSEKSSSSTRDGVPGLQDVPGVQYLFSNKKTNDIQRSVLILVTPRAPVQVTEGDASGIDSETTIRALREKFGLPARVPANVQAIMTHLKPVDFFREFRQGDVSLERWDRMRSTGDRLKEALEFLYY